MDIYFDESRNTGEIGISGSRINYFEQRYFLLVGYIDDSKITKEYEEFKNKYISSIYPDSNETEIKGSDLLTRANNKILDDFIEKFISKDNLLITIYDKKFFLVTNILVWLLGIPFKDKEPISFYKYCEFLIKVDDQFILNFIYTSNNKSLENIDKFLEYIISYDFKECISTPFEAEIRKELVEIINAFRSKGTEYIDLLYDDVILESVMLQGKNRNNIVNLTALGETILLLKIARDISNKEINILHDNIELIENYIKHYFKEIPVNFLDSKNHLQIQLADNVSSIVGKFINNILPVLSDKNLMSALGNDKLWIRKRLSRIFNSVNQKNIKMVVSLREQAFLKTFCLTNITVFRAFKIQLLSNLDKRFLSELSNHLTMDQTNELYKK